MKYQGVIFSMIMALVFSGTKAQDVRVRALLDTNKAFIGDQINLRLLVEKQTSSEGQIVFPALKDSLGGDIEILKISPVDTSKTGINELLTQDLTITIFDTGLFEIPALPFVLRTDLMDDTITSLPVGIEILSLKADSTIKDIKAVYKMPVTVKETVPYVLGGVVLTLLILGLIYYFKHRKSILTGGLNPVSAEPPDIIALQALHHLKDEKPWMNNRVKYYYIRISEILRLYIEGRFSFQALEQTTEEIVLELKSHRIASPDLNRLSSILKLADLVKFAKVIPDIEENARQIDFAVEFVRNTTMQQSNEQPEAKNEMTEVEN